MYLGRKYSVVNFMRKEWYRTWTH